MNTFLYINLSLILMIVGSKTLKEYLNRIPNNVDVKIEVTDTSITFETEWVKNNFVIKRIQCYLDDGTYSTISIESNNGVDNPFEPIESNNDEDIESCNIENTHVFENTSDIKKV